MSSTSRRKGTTPKKAHKVEVSFSNWVMGGSLLSLSTTSSLGSRVSSKGSHKSFDVDTDDEEPPDPIPAVPVKPAKDTKKKETPPPEFKKPKEKKDVCADCGPEPEKSAIKCAPDCPICNEECLWEKHMHEKYGFMECDTCGRGSTWLKDEFHMGRGEYACEKCTPDCAACGRGPLWLSKKWQKTLKRRARKLQGLEKDKKDGDGKKDKGGESTKKAKEGDGEKPKEKAKEKGNEKENDMEKGKGKEKEKAKEKDKTEDKSAEKEKDSGTNKDSGEKKDEDGKSKKGGHEWTSEQDSKLKEMKAQNKSWKEIASEIGVNPFLCKGRFKTIENTNHVPAEKKDEASSGDKQNTSRGGDDGFLGGLGDWNNEDSNQKTDNSGGNGDNQGWGATDTSNKNGDNSGGAADNGWGVADNNNSNNNGETSSGDQTNSGWDNTNGTSGDSGNQGWGDSFNTNANNTGNSADSGWDNDNSRKTADESGGNKDQQNQNKQNGSGKKQNNKNEGNKQDKKKENEVEITASNPTIFDSFGPYVPYVPYKSPTTSGGNDATSWDANQNATSTDTATGQASGGSPKTGNADASGSGWDAANDSWNAEPDTSNTTTGNAKTSSGWPVPNTDWVTIDPSKDNATDPTANDPFYHPELGNGNGNAGATESGSKPADSANNGWFDVNGSNIDLPVEDNARPSWSDLKNGGTSDSGKKLDNTDQNPGNGANSWGQGNNSSNNGGNYWNKSGNENQIIQGGDNSNNNGFGKGNSGGGFNSPNNFNSGGFNQGDNGGDFNNWKNFNPSGFIQGKQWRGKLLPTGAWSQDDCTKLEFLESKYREHKWVQMQADFYNWTGRMIHAELLELKSRRMVIMRRWMGVM
ncbi:hypothetical protein ACEPPN_012762 [Leptodophora sp. 'Broadleaf-Isolate-01']